MRFAGRAARATPGRHARLLRAPQLHRQPSQPARLSPLVHRRARPPAPDRTARSALEGHRRSAGGAERSIGGAARTSSPHPRQGAPLRRARASAARSRSAARWRSRAWPSWKPNSPRSTPDRPRHCAPRSSVGARKANRVQEQTAQLDRQIGASEKQAETIERDLIPQLEQAHRRSHCTTRRNSSPTKMPSELIEEVSKEYDRRRERQPLETVLQNAARYEGDYQTRRVAQPRPPARSQAGLQSALRFRLRRGRRRRALPGRARRSSSSRNCRSTRRASPAQRALAEQELVENFIHRLREQIEEARQQLDYLNDTLADLRFGGERFEFITQARAVAAAGLRYGDGQPGDPGRFACSNPIFARSTKQGWDLLFERLTAQDRR